MTINMNTLTKKLILNISIRLLLLASAIAAGLFFTIVTGFGKSSLNAPKQAIELAQLAVGIAVIAACFISITPLAVLKSKEPLKRAYRYINMVLLVQPVVAVPFFYHFFR